MARQRTLRTRRPLLIAAVIAASACAHAPPGPPDADVRAAIEAGNADVRAAIETANAEYARALVAGDARAMADAFTEDGVLIPEGLTGLVKGRPAIEAYHASRLGQRRYLEVVLTTVQLDVSGDLASEVGTSRVTIRQGEIAPVTLTGRYLAVWRRGPDGRWRIRADVPLADPLP